MERDVIERELTVAKNSRSRFTLAAREADGEIRRLLRENPMPGRISLSFEREPDFFADADLPGETKQTIIARQDQRVVCAGSCAIRLRYVNGEPCRVGYLSGLRLDAGHAGRFDILRRGYECFHQLQAGAPADFYFTSIASDNDRARTLLERGLPGMPRYEAIGEFVTVLISVAKRHSPPMFERDIAPSMKELVAQLNKANRDKQMSVCWSADEMAALQTLGLDAEDFQFVRDGERIIAFAAMWDQRAFKQTVVRGYGPALGIARPALNFLASVSGGPLLPMVGEILANAFVSHLVLEPGRVGQLPGLIERLRSLAAERHVEVLALGMAANDPALGLLRTKFRFREYCSRLYVVSWPEFGGRARELDGRILAPETALL